MDWEVDPPPGGVLRKNVILRCLQVRVVQECDFKGVGGGGSVRRTPVIRGKGKENWGCNLREMRGLLAGGGAWIDRKGGAEALKSIWAWENCGGEIHGVGNTWKVGRLIARLECSDC